MLGREIKTDLSSTDLCRIDKTLGQAPRPSSEVAPPRSFNRRSFSSFITTRLAFIAGRQRSLISVVRPG